MVTTSGQTNRATLRVRDAIDRDYGSELDVGALAKVANVSPAHLIRTFKSVFAETLAASRWRGPDRAALTTTCVISQFRRSIGDAIVRRVEPMKLTTNRLSSIYVLDQDQALDFYVGVLGLEVATDADLGFMRWLTVRVPGDSKEILLERPGPPAHDPQTADEVRALLPGW